MKWTNKPKHINLNYNIHSSKSKHNKSKSKHYNDNQHSIILNLSRGDMKTLLRSLEKYADLKQQGILTEEFQKLSKRTCYLSCKHLMSSSHNKFRHVANSPNIFSMFASPY